MNHNSQSESPALERLRKREEERIKKEQERKKKLEEELRQSQLELERKVHSLTCMEFKCKGKRDCSSCSRDSEKRRRVKNEMGRRRQAFQDNHSFSFSI